jgi:3-deoxy-D-manno-octulosonic acid (KDO) 8-phosphate synthase
MSTAVSALFRRMPFFLIAGCLLEHDTINLGVAEHRRSWARNCPCQSFKASFDKANRAGEQSWSGPEADCARWIGWGR